MHTSGATALMLRAWKPSLSLCLSSNRSKSAKGRFITGALPRTFSAAQLLGVLSETEQPTTVI